MIRRAIAKDIDRIIELLSQVLEIHAEIRPDVFYSGKTKYTNEQLQEMILDDENPIYVMTDDSDYVIGYIFCEISTPKNNIMIPNKKLFIDDLCVDEKYRRQHKGEELFEFAKQEAKRLGCVEVALYVWAGNDSAMKFYEKMGMKPRSYVMEIKL